MGIFGNRLIEARTRLGWRQAELARRAGVPQQSVQAIETSDQRSSKYVHHLAAALGVSSAWLIGSDDEGDGLPLPAGRAAVRGIVAAGLWQEDDCDIGDDTPVPTSPSTRYIGRKQVAYRVVGNSMDRLVSDGEYVICVDFAETPMSLREGDIVVAERRRGGVTERTVKRVRTADDGTTELWPDSNDPDHQQPIRMEHEAEDCQVVIAGIVIGFYRPL